MAKNKSIWKMPKNYISKKLVQYEIIELNVNGGMKLLFDPIFCIAKEKRFCNAEEKRFCNVDEKRFWNSVDIRGDDDCWNWKSYNNNGYGKIGIVRAHRFAYYTKNGSISEGLLVCHKCDNRLCCNPKHLHLGTHIDNMRDTIGKR